MADPRVNYVGASIGDVQAASAPRTIASAVGRLDHLNERLRELAALSAALCNQIGGPYPANGIKGGQPQTEAVGVVARLNDAADTAHATLGDIEDLLKAVGRALG